MSLRDALQNFLADRGYGQPPIPRDRPKYDWFGDFLMRGFALLIGLPIVLFLGYILLAAIWGFFFGS
jgi:hypothetical protein